MRRDILRALVLLVSAAVLLGAALLYLAQLLLTARHGHW